MKKGSLRTILLLSALGLWGYIFYEVYQKITHDDSQHPRESSHAQKLSEVEKSDSLNWQLLLNYPDPFLSSGTYVQPATRNKTAPIQNSSSGSVARPLAKWPQLSYHGSLFARNNRRNYAMLLVNGESRTVMTGDTLAGCKVLTIYRDSVLVGMGTEKRVLRSR